MRKILAADLFCGAGGSSSGLKKACDELGLTLDLLAINHWDIAIATHSKNHAYAQHICETLDNVNPRKVVPSGFLDLLIASPECTHHSIARGGKPCSDQSRASAWHILRWAEALRIDNILIENVKEFQGWGPLGVNGRPMKSRKGETYRAFINALVSLGYKVESRVLRAADYGDPTTRERLFIMARRGRKPIKWPPPTHTPDGAKTLFGETKRWKAAREIIDWSIEGQSIFSRKKPLSKNTMNRIVSGMRKFCGKELEPFLVMLYKTNDARSIDKPMPTVTAQGNHIGVCSPFLVKYNGTGRPQSVEKPLPTQSTKERFGLCEPFILPNEGFYRGNKARSVKKPLNTITSRGAGALVEPFLVYFSHGHDGKSLDGPVPTLTTKEKLGLCRPFLVTVAHTGGPARVRSIEKPVPTLTTNNQYGLCEPFVIGQQSCAAARPVSKPVPTIAGAGAIALVHPKFEGKMLDIRFRMLQPHELARAMSFDEGYEFEGNREARVKQIGNAVPVMLAKELCKSLLN